jgi:hypothetical protein
MSTLLREADPSVSTAQGLVDAPHESETERPFASVEPTKACRAVEGSARSTRPLKRWPFLARTRQELAIAMATSHTSEATTCSMVFPILATPGQTALTMEGHFDVAADTESRKRWLSLVSLAAGEVFEDGMVTEFSKAVERLLSEGSTRELDALEWLLGSPKGRGEIGAHALRWLCRVTNRDTYFERLLLACRMLASPSAKIRDAACLALEALGDPAALINLDRAASREAIP